MKQKLLINHCRVGRMLVALLALTLLPMGVWAEDYDLWVAGVQVTSDNATNVTGDGITAGTISFDVSTNTLTLNNAQVNGAISSSITNLKIHLVGSSVFTVDNENATAYFLTYTGEEQGATVTMSTEAIGASLKAIATSSANYLNDTNTYTINASEGNWNYWGNSTGTDENSLWYVKFSKPYVWVAGDNIDDSNLDQYTSGGQYSYNKTTNTVTLSGLQPGGSFYDSSIARENLVKSNLAALNVVVSGTNALFMKSGNTITSRVFKYTGASGESSRLNLTLQDGATIEATWDTGVSASLDYLVEGFTEHNISVDLEKMETSGPLAEVDDTEMTISNMTFYDLWILGTQVNSKNAAQIVGDDDHYVSFDGNHTLTINNYFSQNDDNFDGPFISNGFGDLTINLIGVSNGIKGYSSFIGKSTDGGDNYTATFTTTANNAGRLSVYSDLATGHTVEYTGGLSLSTSNDGNYYIIGLTDYQLTVGDVAVTSANASSITGETIEGTVSYDIDNHMLTLNGATIDGMITTSQPALTITFAGDNSLMAIAGENGTLEFTGTGTLSLNHSDGVINGFSSVDFGSFNLQSSQPGGVHWDEENSSLRSYDDDAVANLTLTTTVLYPIWVYDGQYQQVTATNNANVLGDDYSSVSYDGNGTLTVKGAQIDYMECPSIVVGEDIPALTVHLVGYNQIGGNDEYAFKFLGENTTLAFTTSETLPGCLLIGDYFSEGLSGDISYQNGLALDYKTISVSQTANTDVSHITGFTSVINEQDGAVFFYSDGSINWMSNGELSHERPVYVKVLSEEGDATSTAGIWPSSLSNPSLLNKVAFQFDWGACTNKNVTVQVRGFKQVYNQETYETTWEADGKTYSDAISLSSANADGIIEIPLTSTVTSGTIQLYFSSSQAFSFVPLTVALKSANEYNIQVAGVTVSDFNVSNVLGDDLTEEGSVASVSFDPETNTLTLNGASIIPETEGYGLYYTGTDNLTISLKGSNTVKGKGNRSAIAYSNNAVQTIPTLTFTNGGTELCSLQLEAETQTISGFESVVNTGLYKIDETIFGADQSNIYQTTITSTLLAGGTGTSDDPFLIETKEDLAAFAQYVNTGVITTEYVKLNGNINCSELTGFMPIGTSDYPFTGTFTNSDNYTISNLNCTTAGADGYIGLFGVVGLDGATSVAGSVSGLILDNCSFSGGSVGGAIAGYLSYGTISHCMVTNSSVTTNSGDGPTSAGIVGESFGTITNCTVSGSEITATTSVGSYSTTAGGIVGTNGGTISNCEVNGTTDVPTLIKSINNSDGSDPYRQAGGIVGDCVDDNGVTITISGNSVTGATTVDCEDTGNAAQAGSIIGRRNNNNITLTNNFYEYTVKTIIKNNNVTDERTGYAQRGSGDFVYDGETQTNVYTDITANNGAVMYTKILTLPAESALGAVMGDEGGFYAYAEGDTYGILGAPGHPVKVKVIPGDDCSISDISVTYGTDQTAAIALTKTEEGTSFYTISEMPDANATLNVTFSQAYDLWIGETQVTSTNAAHILGEENTTVTFSITGNEEDGYVNTLTLNNASLTQRVVSGLDNLTVLLKGANTIAIADSSSVFKSTESTATLTITKEGENASLTISNQLDGGTSGNKFPLIWNFASLDYSTAGLYLNTSIPTKYTSGTVTTTGFSGEDITANGLFGLYNRSSWESPFSATFSTVASYQLWVADTQVTDNNKNNITGTDTPQVTFTPAENTNAAKLSLISAALQGHVISGVGDLNIYFSGDNSIEGTDTASVIRSIDTTAKLTFSSANNSKLELSQPDINDAYSSIRGFGSMELGDNVCIENQLTDPVSYSTNPDLGLVDDLDKQTPIHNLTMSSAYQLWVSGEQVSYANQNSICQGSVGEGKIRFDGDHTLTLDNVPDIVFNGTSSFIKTSMDLTINLVGDSYFDCGSSTFISKLDNDNSDYTVTFTTSATNPGMLTLQAGSIFVGFEKAFENKLAWKPAGYYDETDQNAPAAWIAQPSLGLKVGDIYVTTDNADNILGEDLTEEGSVASVSYNPETYTLTLNNAELTSSIHWVTDADLTIELKGTNSMNTTKGVCITSEYSKELSFTGGGDNCSLEFSRVEDYHFFSGFSNAETPSMGTGMYWIPTWDNNGQIMTSVLITNAILGGGKGTEGSPFIISTFEHLKTFAKYVNDGILSTEYVKLGGNIDCTNETGFEPIGNIPMSFIGTFNGDGNSIIGLTFSNTNPDGVAGLFGNIGSYNSNNDIITRGTVMNLTLNGCQFGNASRNGAIVGNLAYGTIENCTVTSCTISSGNSQSTFSGGIAGIIEVEGIVEGCTVNGGTITSSTSDTEDGEVCAGGIVAEASGSSEINGCTVTDVSINSTGNDKNSYSGGIVGYSQATISGNSVKGTTTVNSINNNNDNVFVGAIVANSVEGSLENNYYYFTVNTQTKIGNNNPVVKSGYTQRAVGNRIYNEQTEQYEDAPDVTEDNGAVLYTKALTIGVASECESDYYEPLSDYENRILAIAPGQTVNISLYSDEEDEIITAASLVYTPTGGTEQTVNLENESENPGEYNCVFVMPDADATLNATVVQTYDLWIGETQVTSTNAAHILGEENTTVTFAITGNEENGFVNTLTLNGATLTEPVKIGLANLTIDVQGTNSITTNTTCIQNTAGDNNVPSLTFKSSGDEVGNLTLTNSDEDYTGVISESYYGHFTINQELALVMLRYGEYTSDSYYFTAGEVHDAQLLPFYGVQVGNMQIHSGNAEDVFGDGTVSFNKTTNTLTLNDANKGALSTWLPELKVELVGNNKLSEGSSYPVLRSLNDAKVTIKIQSTGTTKGSLTMSQPYTEDGDFYDGNVTVSIIEPLTVISGSLTGNDGNANTVVIGEPYNLWIAGTQVTSANASNILGDDLSEEGSVASVSFDAAENTLTLNEATITPESEVSGIAYMGKDDLIISLKGANRVEGSMGCAAIAYNGESNTPPTLTFVKGDAEGSCSLQLEATDEATIFGFGEVSCIGLIMFDEVVEDGVHTASIMGYPVLDVTDDVTFADGQKWASYYNATQSFLLPEGYMAYIVTEVGETSVTIAPINYVPGDVPVLIEKDSETTTDNTSADGNLLRGAAEDVDVSEIDGTVYGLHNNKMMRVNQGTIPAHRAYLVADEAVARELAILFGEGELTTVRETLTDAAGSGDWYTIDGRKLQKKPTKKGLYINNGHTVVIK